MRLVAVALLVAGCAKHTDDRPKRCASAAHQSVTAIVKRAHDQHAPAQDKLDALASRLEAVFADHCVAEKWPRAVVDCVNDATAMDELRACEGQLPPASFDKVQTDMMRLIAADAPPAIVGSDPGPLVPVSQAEHDAAVAEANKLAADLQALGVKVNAATQKVAAAASDAERKAAQAELDALTKQADELRSKLTAAQARAR